MTNAAAPVSLILLGSQMIRAHSEGYGPLYPQVVADVWQAAAGRASTSENGGNRGQASRSLREPSSAMPIRVRANKVRGIQRFKSPWGPPSRLVRR